VLKIGHRGAVYPSRLSRSATPHNAGTVLSRPLCSARARRRS
jgi:hypothetical protein